MRHRNRAETLKAGATALLRRAAASVKVDMDDPTDPTPPAPATEGHDTAGHNWLHITISLPDSGTTANWRLWTYDEAAGKWGLRTDIGTNPVSEAGGTDPSAIQIAGIARVYVQLIDLAGGTFTDGADVWLSGSTAGGD